MFPTSAGTEVAGGLGRQSSRAEEHGSVSPGEQLLRDSQLCLVTKQSQRCDLVSKSRSRMRGRSSLRDALVSDHSM